MPDDPTQRPKPMDEQAEFVLADVDASAQERKPFEDIWNETEENFLVRPFSEPGYSSSATNFPLGDYNDGYGVNYGPRSGEMLSNSAVLKDPSTHSAVMSIVSSIALSLFPEPGFVSARRVGFEDILKAKTTSSLIEYVFSMPHHFFQFVQWLLSTGIFGTGWLEGGWEFKEEPQTLRTVRVDPFGDVRSTFEVLVLPEYDDIRFRHLPLRHVYPAAGTRSPCEIKGITKRFRITANQARAMADKGIYRKEAVERAINMRASQIHTFNESENVTGETGFDYDREVNPDFMEMDGYERFGEVPFRSDDGFFRRVITVFGGETVRSDVWPRKLPIFPMNIIPRSGSPYGLAPAEVIRYDQDLADTLKMMIADAVVRGTNAPQVYEEGANVDLAALRQFKLNRPIKADRTDAIRQVDYNPPVDGAMGMYGVVTQHIQDGSSAEGAFTGQQGPDRESATGFAGRLQQASQRPELFNMICERTWLPPVGTFTLKLYQEMLENDEALKNRIGESEATVSLSDILADFDVRFVGTRINHNRAQQLQAFREIVAAGSHPVISQITPWMPLIRKFYEQSGAPELAAMVGNPEMMQLNVLLNRIAVPNQGNGNGNGTIQAPATGEAGQLEGGLL